MSENKKGTLRRTHLFILQLFRIYGAMTDRELWKVYRDLIQTEGSALLPEMRESGMRTRRSELCSPRGAGIHLVGRKGGETIWDIDKKIIAPMQFTKPTKEKLTK